MATILALDLGTTTGFAATTNGAAGPIVTGTWSFKTSRYEGGGVRYLRFQQKVDEFHKLSPIKRVVFEEVRRHRGTDAAHVYGGLLSMLTAWCEEHKIPYEGVPVGTIKRFATGKGNATKDEMLEATRSWGYQPSDDNEADAIAILHWFLNENG